jgi:transcriptional regulator with XRE-family HTH domain
MVIGEKLRVLRAQKNMSQGDIEKRTGLLRRYISRVENGHTVPSVDTLEKMPERWKFRCTGCSGTTITYRSRICRLNSFPVGRCAPNQTRSFGLWRNYFLA